MDFSSSGPGNFYTEASARAGSAHTEFKSSDLRDDQNRMASYDASSPYYGIHAGMGYVWNVTDKTLLDLHAKYFWTRQQGTSAHLSTGDPVKFKAADSQRLRLGGQMSFVVNDYVKSYGGLYWEHEFDGRARATTYGYPIATPKLRGDTGVGELGLSIAPAKIIPLTIDIAIQGYTGKREGVTGSLQVKYEF